MFGIYRILKVKNKIVVIFVKKVEVITNYIAQAYVNHFASVLLIVQNNYYKVWAAMQANFQGFFSPLGPF